MTLPVGRNGSSGSRTGVLDTLCCTGKELLQSLCACTCAFVLSTLVCLSMSFKCVHVVRVNLEPHNCSRKFVKPSAFLSLSSFCLCMGMKTTFTVLIWL